MLDQKALWPWGVHWRTIRDEEFFLEKISDKFPMSAMKDHGEREDFSRENKHLYDSLKQ